MSTPTNFLKRLKYLLGVFINFFSLALRSDFPPFPLILPVSISPPPQSSHLLIFISSISNSSPSKPFLLSPLRLSLRPLRLSPLSSPLTSRFVAAVAGEKLSDDTELVVKIGGDSRGEGRFDGDGDDSNSGGGEEESGEEEKKMSRMSMSQKLTLGYAALVGGVVPNLKGRVVSSHKREHEKAEHGLYVVGWLKRGPTGIIATNLYCADETVTSILEDAAKGSFTQSTKPGRQGLQQLLEHKNVRFVPFSGWEKIDTRERAEGQLRNKPREKIT